ncbi:MAG: ATP-binding cassette domain-containing protein [Pigmentiphaga sp.]|nr:ATP-binding cassette domain-containing protein [Pigmentiphaga sp.]
MPDTNPAPALMAKDLVFAYPRRAPLLDLPELRLMPGHTLFLYGPSGCGKSTLLNLLAGTLQPQAGHILLAGHELTSARSWQRDRLRGDCLGFLFQQFNLLPFLSVLDNVMLPCRFAPGRRQRAVQHHGSVRAAALALLAHLGLDGSDLPRRRAGQLSVGQQQRVAAARALIGQPAVVLADEPTSALDADTQARFLQLLFDECRANGSALLFVSHDQRLADAFDEVRDLREWNRATPKVAA